MKKYIITGAPGSGKTSIILGLEQLGEWVINEAADSYIKFKQASGIKEPWKKSNFQNEILKLQLQRENKICKGLKRIFIDRGIPDGLAYLNKNENELREKIIKKTKELGYEKKVFLIKQLNNIETNNIRREDYNKAKELEKRLEKEYINLGFKIIKIKSDLLIKRINNILKKCE